MGKIALNNVSVGYHATCPIITDISATLSTGKVYALVGANGSGKSTLLKTLLKIQPTLQGEIIWQNQSQNAYSAKAWSRIFSAVFATSQGVPAISVHDLIWLGTLPHNAEEADQQTLFQDIVKWLQLESLISFRADELSDGQLQKVFLARALMQHTPFVIFDEPTSHLDYIQKFQIFELLHSLAQKTQKCFLIATHEIDWGLQMADELWYCHKGKLHTGIPEEVAFQQNLWSHFSTPKVSFNYNEGKFERTPIPSIPKIIGEGPLAYWVTHFCKRKAENFQNVSEIVLTQNQLKVVGEITQEFSDFSEFCTYFNHQ